MEEEERSVAETTLWGLDNLFHCHIKLSARDVGSLKRYREDVSQVALLPPAMRPVRFLQLIGRIVGLSRSGRKTILHVDDSTGIVEAVLWSDIEDKLKGRIVISLGCLVVVFGRVDWYRCKLTVSITKLQTLTDPNLEVLWWLETSELRRKVYSSSTDLMSVLDVTGVVRNGEGGGGEGNEGGKEAIVEFVGEERKSVVEAEPPYVRVLLEYVRDETVRVGQAKWKDIVENVEMADELDLVDKTAEFAVRMQTAIGRLCSRGLIYCSDRETGRDEHFAALYDGDVSAAIVRIVEEETTRASATLSPPRPDQRKPPDCDDDGSNDSAVKKTTTAVKKTTTAVKKTTTALEQQPQSAYVGAAFVGCRQDRILAKLPQYFPRCSISPETINTTLERLVHLGEVYEVEEGSYRPVNK